MTTTTLKEQVLKELVKAPSGLTCVDISENTGLDFNKTYDALRFAVKDGTVFKSKVKSDEGVIYEISPLGQEYLKNGGKKTPQSILKKFQAAHQEGKFAAAPMDGDLPPIDNLPPMNEQDKIEKLFENAFPPPTQKHFFAELDDDSVFSPLHYNQGGIECIEALRACMSDDEYRGFCRGNVIKYLWRLNDKATPQENIKKARWYLDTLQESYE